MKQFPRNIAVKIVKTFEGFSPVVYNCVGGHKTIGYGHRVCGTQTFEQPMTQAKAEVLLVRDLIAMDYYLHRLVRVRLNPGQEAALLSFIFNVGPAAFERSTLRQKVNRGEHEAVPQELLKWVWAGNRKSRGLERRRMAEGILYETGCLDQMEMKLKKTVLGFLTSIALCSSGEGSLNGTVAPRTSDSKRDLHYLEDLKTELAKAEDLPGGLEQARKLKRQIAAIEKGTDIYTPIHPVQPALPQETKALATPLAKPLINDVVPTSKAPQGPIAVTHTKAGDELDLFHEKTITVGEEYGVPKDMMRSVMGKNHSGSTHGSSFLHKPLSIPQSGTLRAPGANSMKPAAMQAPLYGALPSRQVPTPKMGAQFPPQKDHRAVDAMRFQRAANPLSHKDSHALYGTPPDGDGVIMVGKKVAMGAPAYKGREPLSSKGALSKGSLHKGSLHKGSLHKGSLKAPLYGTPSRGTVVPSTYQTMHSKNAMAWQINKKEGAYLEDKLRTKLAQLAHARRQLSGCDGQQADAWTSRIYDLETEKRSLLRMMKSLGVKPSFTKVSLSEDPEFDTVQSEDYLLKRQLHETEKQEKKLRRKMRFSNDPEVLTNVGERLAMVERNRKLLEASLKNLQQNKENVNKTAVVARPRIYQAVGPNPSMTGKKEGTVFSGRTPVKSPKPLEKAEKKPAPIAHPVFERPELPQPKRSLGTSKEPLKDSEEQDDWDTEDRDFQPKEGLWSHVPPSESLRSESLRSESLKNGALNAPLASELEASHRVDLEEAQVISATWGDAD